MHATSRNFFLTPAKRLSRSSVGQRGVSSVGLIGLGNMGSGMAANIIKKMPDKSIFYDINPASIKKIAGAKSAISIKQLAASSEMIITMLPNSKHVADTCRGNDGIFKVSDINSYFL
jgi:3-hydroxyisobutyrate dehydrogenase-like beta-hydroxyacid dehydrogenase